MSLQSFIARFKDIFAMNEEDTRLEESNEETEQEEETEVSKIA